MARAAARYVCQACGAEHRQWAGRCDACGTPLVTRTDDAPETVAARLENQLDSLQAVVALYRDSGRLGVVSGSGSIAEIGERHEGVTTVGHAQCWPGVVTAVAGETRITMDMRHISAESLKAMFDEAHEAAAAAAEAEGCTIEWEHIFRIPPMAFHPKLLESAHRHVRDIEGHDFELPSGALHDASEVAREIPTVMIFSSSIRIKLLNRPPAARPIFSSLAMSLRNPKVRAGAISSLKTSGPRLV